MLINQGPAAATMDMNGLWKWFKKKCKFLFSFPVIVFYFNEHSTEIHKPPIG